MSSRSKRSPQPVTSPPRLLISEVRAEEPVGATLESPAPVIETRPSKEVSSNRAAANEVILLPEPSLEKAAAKGRKPATKGAKGASAKEGKAASASQPSKKEAQLTPAKAVSQAAKKDGKSEVKGAAGGPEVRVRRIHRRDLNRTWEFLKLVFRGVNRETVEYQRPRSKVRFMEVYEEDGEQLLFEVGDQIVGYAECAFDASGADNWINPRYFDKRGMRPLYVDELAVHPDYQGRGVGAFMLEQVQHLARVRGCTHLVLEVAENNKSALTWYHKRNFFRLDAAIFLAQKVPAEPELLPPRRLPQKPGAKGKAALPAKGKARIRTSGSGRTRRR